MKSRLLDALFLFLVVGGALVLRSYFCFSLIFHGGRVHLRTDDPYFHVHLEQNLVHHFPRPNVFDPTLHFPSGQEIRVGPLLDLLVSGIALLAAAGRPDAAPIEAVAAWMPAVLGALTALPIFFLARRLWGRWAAYPATVLIAVMPGQFLRRSMLGFADHHALEAFCVVLFLCVAGLCLEGGSITLRRAVPVGIALAAYLAAWPAADVVVAILAAWLVAEFAIGLATAAPELAAGAVLARALPVAAFLLLPCAAIDIECRRHVAVCLALGAVSIALVAVYIRLRRDRRLPRTGGLTFLAAAVLALASIPEVFPRVGMWLVKAAARLSEGSGNAMISEDAPLFSTGQGLSPLFREFGPAWIAAVLGIAITVAMSRRRRSSIERLLLLWTAIMLLLTLRQNRFSYYLAAGVALFAGRAIAAAARWSVRSGRFVAVVVAAGLAAVCFRPALAIASHFSGPSPDWEESLSFLKLISPAPFTDPLASQRLYPSRFEALPDEWRARYGVLAWWDYGYWILGIAERVPVANPSQIGNDTAAKFLLGTNPASALTNLEKRGIRYVLLDSLLPVLPANGPGSPLAGKFAAIASTARQPLQRFFETAVDPGGLKTVYFTQDYFRTMLVRLYLFGGRHVEPVAPFRVAKFRASVSGTTVEDLRTFNVYSEAMEFARNDPRRRLVSLDPTSPCVELEPSDGFSEIHDSPSRFSVGSGTAAIVETFEVSAR